MEIVLKEQMDLLADKVETFLFGDTATINAGQAQYFQSFFTESYIFPMNLLRYLRQEIALGFSFNVLLFTVLVCYIPSNFYYCLACDSLMTIWLLVLSTINTMVLVPKMLLLRKLYKIEENQDIYLANFTLWTFFRSKVYKFNSVMSRYIFCTYLVGGFLIWWTKITHCLQFFCLLVFLLASFAIRVIASFLKFSSSFNNPQNAEELFDLFNGISTEEIDSLRVIAYEEYVDKFARHELTCPICYDEYEKPVEMRIMECPGDHAFHKKCIDKWLMKSDKCPMCNLSVFSKRKKEEGNG